jgi:hypothetical protein
LSRSSGRGPRQAPTSRAVVLGVACPLELTGALTTGCRACGRRMGSFPNANFLAKANTKGGACLTARRAPRARAQGLSCGVQIDGWT